MAADDAEEMTHHLAATRKLQAADCRRELIAALTNGRRVGGLMGGAKSDDIFGKGNGTATRHLVSFLPSMGDFPEAILQLVYDREDLQSDVDVLHLADGFFLDVHPVFSVGSLVAFLSRSHRGTLAEVHVWRLLKVVMIDRSDAWKLWDAGMWKEAFPEKEWEDVCLIIVGWFVTIAEIDSPSKIDAFRLVSLLPRWLHRLFDDCISVQGEDVEKVTVLCGTFLRRCLNRGMGSVLTNALLDRYRFDRKQDVTSTVKALRHVRDPHALEKFFECLLSSPTQNRIDVTSIVRAVYLEAEGTALQDEMTYVLFHRILTKGPLPKRTAKWLIDLIVESGNKLQEIVCRLAKTWSDKEAIDHLPLPMQGYRTYLLMLSIPHLSSHIGDDDRVTRWLLEGISHRLGHPLDTVRFQGMRVAHTIAAQQPNADPLFHEIDADFQSVQEDERWDDTDDVAPSEDEAVASNERSIDSDDDSNVSSIEEHDLEPLVTDDISASVVKKGHRPMTLTDVHRDLQDTEEPMKTVAALKCLPLLLKEHPNELPSMAAALSRTLVHVALPDWISEEMMKDDAGEMKGLLSSTAVRVHCLSLLLTEAPLHCGGHVATMVASKQLAEYQRLESLEALRRSAMQLSRPPRASPTPEASNSRHLHDGKTRTWGMRSLQKHRKPLVTWRNRFVDVVGLWLSSLLHACRSRDQGFDIMDRNPVVLSGVLITLGTFAECASDSIASTSVALTSFPLVRAAMEQKGSNVHLRRCGFRALASLIGSIPISRLSAAVDAPLSLEVNDTDEQLREMLVWIKERTEKAVVADSDESCRGLAGHALHLCSQRSRSALERSTSNALFPKPLSIEFRIPSVRDTLLK